MTTHRPHSSQTHQTESVQKSPTDAPDPLHRRRRSLLFSVHQNLAIEFSSPASLLSQLPTHLSQSFLTPSSSTVPSVRHPVHSRRPSLSAVCGWTSRPPGTRLLPTTISLAPPDHHRENHFANRFAHNHHVHKVSQFSSRCNFGFFLTQLVK
jgi:hypothetical protein